MSTLSAAEDATSHLGGAVPMPESWNPRWHAHFDREWLTFLLSRFGHWCHVTDLWAPQDAYQRTLLRQRAHETVMAARRLGFFIESDRRRGYRVTGHDDLPRYLHLRSAEDEPQGPYPGQLSLADAVE